MPESTEALLARGLVELALDPALADPLARYLDELWKWNRAYNLTAIRDPREMAVRHVLDSLAVLPALPPLAAGGRLIDVGSGAGLPGLMLAIARPDWQVTTLDSVGKKARFMRQAIRQLGLRNARVVEARAEAHQPEVPYELVISRAFASLEDFLRWSAALGGADSRWCAMKARLDDAERAAVPAGFEIERAVRLKVPMLPEARQLVVLRRRAA